MDNSTQGETMKFYDVPIKVNTDPSLNASDLLLERVAINPSHPIFSRQNTDGTWRNVTSQEFLDEVRSLAKGLIAQGIKPGDAVTIQSQTPKSRGSLFSDYIFKVTTKATNQSRFPRTNTFSPQPSGPAASNLCWKTIRRWTNSF